MVREFATICADSGVVLLDCGVTPGDKAADNGMITMVGGEDEAVGHAKPVLADFAKEVVHCGLDMMDQVSGSGFSTSLEGRSGPFRTITGSR